jgi:hypothetical protein
MRPSGPNANALMSSSMLCSGFSKSTTCDRAAGTLQHPNTAHTNAQKPRSQRNRLREHGQIIDCLWSSLRFEYAHHQTRFSHSPSRNLSLTPALEKNLEKDVRPGKRSFQTPFNLSNPAQNSHSERSRPTVSSALAPAKASVCAVEESLLDPARSQAIPLHTHHSFIPSPPLAPSPSEFPPTSVATALQILDPSGCSTCAPPNSPANMSCP